MQEPTAPGLRHGPAPGAPGHSAADPSPRPALPDPRSGEPHTAPESSRAAKQRPWWQRTGFWLTAGMILTLLCVGAIVLIWWDLHTMTMTPVPIP